MDFKCKILEAESLGAKAESKLVSAKLHFYWLSDTRQHAASLGTELCCASQVRCHAVVQELFRISLAVHIEFQEKEGEEPGYKICTPKELISRQLVQSYLETFKLRL